MHNIKRRTIYSITSLFVMFLTGSYVLGEICDLSSIWYRWPDNFNYDIQEIKKKQENVELIFLGSSRVYRSFVPSVFEEKLDFCNVINAGTSGQPIAGSYYLLKELLKEFQPKFLILDVTFDSLINNIEGKLGKLIVLERLKGGNRYDFIRSCFYMDEWKYFLRMYRFRDFDPRRILENYKNRNAILKGEYVPDYRAKQYYADKGFVYGQNILEDGNIGIEGSDAFIDVGDISDHALQYLNKIVQLCRENDIRLFFVTAPTSLMSLYNNPDYYINELEFYRRYAGKNDIVYHNLNFIRDREKILPDHFMQDYTHVNGKGAYAISDLYADILNDEIAGEVVSNYFYEGIQELRKNVHRCVAVGADFSMSDDCSTISIDVFSLQNEDIDPLYQIKISDNKNDYQVAYDWTTDTHFILNLTSFNNPSIEVRAKTGKFAHEIEAFQDYTDFAKPPLLKVLFCN